MKERRGEEKVERFPPNVPWISESFSSLSEKEEGKVSVSVLCLIPFLLSDGEGKISGEEMN